MDEARRIPCLGRRVVRHLDHPSSGENLAVVLDFGRYGCHNTTLGIGTEALDGGTTAMRCGWPHRWWRAR